VIIKIQAKITSLGGRKIKIDDNFRNRLRVGQIVNGLVAPSSVDANFRHGVSVFNRFDLKGHKNGGHYNGREFLDQLVANSLKKAGDVVANSGLELPSDISNGFIFHGEGFDFVHHNSTDST
jgi:hypothetical protein